ncbi:hypothetical protein [Sphingobacterium pedocola]|uniref:Secreted protein n=1 Tax=Sphingobacterium pedocola TaxID=2082722 RepID=A0ABR9T9N5_9SPHI|nr:hypothetical protein [Sphingobacterium pedocola]MBE8722023.1 hypothetical protein [Sphingobacterium pedocola]
MTLIKKTTKTLVLGVALLGLAVGASSWASAKATLAQDETMWGRTQDGNWVELQTPEEQQADCNPDPNICKAVYLTGFTPTNGSASEPGFVRIEQNNGHIDLP